MSSSKSTTSTMMSLLTSKSLSSMVKGIRAHKTEHAGNAHAEAEFIAKCMAEIKAELQTNFPDVKAVAVQKLIYLQMLGYDISWAAFHIIELMSAAWFGHKRIGYLAASLSFTKSTDVILLTTHLFRKGFNSQQGQGGGGATAAAMSAEGFQYETGAAISCLANIVTPDLAQDLLADVYNLINSSRPYVRKKAVLVLLRMFHAWPKALRLSFDRLKDKLDDENQGVVSAAVYVICELAAKNPKNYLSLAPQFFKILTTSSNNWVLIKVVKLLGSLVPLEPRLAKKLTEPLTDIITTTPAKSLLYEAVNTLLCGELRSKTVVKLCLEKLRNFIEDPDQNLKYLGLLGLHKLLQKQPRVVAEHKDLILACLGDDDVTIRMRALDLITSMVSLKNLAPITGKLLNHLAVAELGAVASYREHVLSRILFICAQDGFAYVQDFEWYIAILVDLTRLAGVSRDNALQINAQLLEVVVRVPGVRSYTIKHMSNILLSKRLLPGAAADAEKDASAQPLGAVGGGNHSSASESGSTAGHMSEVLCAVGFIIGEYPEYIEAQDDALFESLMSNLASPRILQASPAVQNVFVQAIAKLLSAALLQPFDNASVKDQLSTAQSKATTRKAASGGEETSSMAGEGDEMPEVAPTEEKVAEEEELGEEEEEDFDSNGLRRRKHPSLKRSFAAWHAWIGRLLNILYQSLPAFARSDSVEVQERSVVYLQFIKWLIVQGEWTGAIEGWTGGAAAAATPAAKPAVKQEEKEEKSAAPPAAAAAAAPVRELNLLGSLDPLSDNSLDIFGTAPAANAAPASAKPTAPVASADALFSSLSISTGAASSSSNGTFSPALKDRLRSLSIQLGLLYSERLNPVHPKAQRKVALPKGLNLEVEINPGADTADIPDDEQEDDVLRDIGGDDDPYSTSQKKSKPRGGLYEDDFESQLGYRGFGAPQPKVRSSTTTNKSKGNTSGGSGSGGFFDDVSSSPSSYSKERSSDKDKSDARQREERRRQVHRDDPYYIKDAGSSAAAVDHIPVRRLDDADLPTLRVSKEDDDILAGLGGSSSSSKSSSKPKKAFKVLKDEALPSEGSDDDDDGGRKRSKKDGKKSKKDSSKSSKRKSSQAEDSDNDALDMDLSAPLGADEVMPRVKSYAETQAEKQKAAEAAAAAAADKSSSKDRKSSHRERRSSRDEGRSSKDSKREKDRKSDRKDKDSAASSSASSAAAATAAKPAASTASFLDLFDMSGSAPAAAAAPSSRKSTSSSSSSSAAPAASPSSSSSSSSSSSASGDSRIREQPLFKDSLVKVKTLATLASSSGSSVIVAVEVQLAADNSKRVNALPKVTLEVKAGKHVRSFAAAPGSSAAKVSDKGVTLTLRDVAAGSSRTEKFVIDFASTVDRAFTLSARISYTTDREGKGKEDESVDLEVPLSTFVQARKLTPSELASALSSAPSPPTKLASATLALKRVRVSEALRLVSAVLNVSLVEAVSFTATYYGTLRHDGSGVAVLVKARKGDESAVSVEVKSNSTRISEALMEEITSKLK